MVVIVLIELIQSPRLPKSTERLCQVIGMCVCVCVCSTDFQERASSFCTGMCMYQEHKPYSACFDACNW